MKRTPNKPKEIWHVWKGVGNPPARVVSVLYRCGVKLGYSGKLKPSDEYSGWCWNQALTIDRQIIAYTLGQTKAESRIKVTPYV